MDKAVGALKYIVPLLRKYNFQWVITGGFACLAYGVKRPLTDIDIDINTAKDSPQFKLFTQDVKPYTTQDLEHYVDQNYDNYNLEVTYEGQVIDICPMAELKIFDRDTNSYIPFYHNFPNVQFVDFHGLDLPLLPKDLIIKNKEMLMWQRESDFNDIAGLRKLLTK